MTQSDSSGSARAMSASTQFAGDQHANEFHLRAVMEAIPGFVWSALPDGAVEFCNRRWLDYAGLSLDEVRNKELTAAIPTQDKSEFDEQWQTALSEGTPFEAEARIRRRDGCFRWFLIRALPLRDDKKGISRWCGTNVEIEDLKLAHEEIAERKRVEERLRESEARFQVMADTAPVMIWLTGTDGLCNYFNKPWLDFTGRTMEQEVGTGWVEGVHPDDVQGCFDGFLPAFHARKPFRIEYRLRRTDGEYRWLIESGIPRYAGGEFAGYIGSNIDITELKHAEEERERLRQVESELARINRVTTMGELAASITHEIKQPISAAVSNAEACLQWLSRTQPDLAEVREAATEMVKEARRASEIMTRVRALFKKDEIRREALNLNEVIADTVSLIREEADRRSISVHTDLDAELPRLSADRVQLHQVLINLTLNGLEAMNDTGGKLVISSRQVEVGRLLISVSDLGPGLPVGKRDQIFDAFFTTKPQGTGMGLAISRAIVESHGGRLWATGNPDRGTTFHFTLPLELQASSASAG